jgi:hypothetical protein
MYRIVGKANLKAVNRTADECISILDQLKDNQKDAIYIDRELVQRLAQGYLYMYNKSIEHSIMPGIMSKPHLYDEYIQ